MLAEILLSKNDDGSTGLELFHFYNNMSGDNGAKAISRIIANSKTLKDLRFSATRSGHEGCMHIATAIGTLSGCLKRLDLSDNTFGDAACEELARSLAVHKALEHINFRDDSLSRTGSRTGINLLLSALSLQCGETLSFFDLSGNELSAEQIPTLIHCEALRSLKELYLDDNEIGSEGAVLLAKALQRKDKDDTGTMTILPQLSVLSCQSCEISSKGGFYLSNAVSKRSAFTRLELNGNYLSEAVLDHIKEQFADGGKTLGDMDDNDEDGDEDEDFDLEEEMLSTQLQDTSL